MEVIRMFRNVRTWLSAAAVLGAGAGATAAVAQAAEPEIELVTKPARSFERAIETHKVESRYHQVRTEARKLDAGAGPNLLASQDTSLDELRDRIDVTQERVEEARERRAAQRATSESFTLAGGVSQATLDAIAACESGGDPTAVNPAGYYGKYQFDMGTWASVGGSGNPAEASEAEQDYRASLLYSRAGSSPWPVCGA
jgi:soluble lytic murein transglycosylase-like protein